MNNTNSIDQINFATNSLLEPILNVCKKYTNDELYVYKVCCDILSNESNKDNIKWLVVMKKLDDTKTNEGRKNIVNKDCAKFRANKLLVVKIININKPSLSKKYIVNKYQDYKSIRYEVGKIVIPNEYDENIENVNSGGIHYFRTILPAFYRRDTPDDYSGNSIEWYENGQKESEGLYVDGYKFGKWTKWYENGQKEDEGEYNEFGYASGFWTEYYENGQKKSCGNYDNGYKIGNWITWQCDCGQKRTEGEYDEEGLRTGVWTEWSCSGKKKSEGKYIEGEKIGHWIEWDCATGEKIFDDDILNKVIKERKEN